MSGQITSPDQALKFMFAGKATVTLKSGKTGSHITFKVKAPKDRKPDGPSHFIAVRTGGPGETIFAYLGFMTSTGQYVHGRKSKIEAFDQRVRAFKFALANLQLKQMPPNCEIWHEGKCGRCARKLTDPTSIASGFGPECITKMECI